MFNATNMVIAFVGAALFVFIISVVGFWIYFKLTEPRKTMTEKQRADWFIQQFERNRRRKEVKANK